MMRKQVLPRNDFAKVVGDYLGVIIPEDKHSPGSAEVIFLDDTEMNSVLSEGPRQRFLHRAVYDLSNSRILASFEVAIDHCEDHFPDHPTIPMGKLGQVMAQVGAALIFMESRDSIDAVADREENGNNEKNIIFVNNVQSIDSFTATIEGRKKIFIVPGDRLLIVAERGKEKIATKGSFICVYAKGGLMATMEVVFEMLPWKIFSRLYQRQNRVSIVPAAD